MGRFYGKVGYAISVERMTEDNPPLHTGIFEDKIIEKDYYGNVIRRSAKWQESGNVNDDLGISCQISIVADAFACQNFSRIKYVEYMGVKWKTVTVDPQRPRIILTLGGEYNGEEA